MPATSAPDGASWLPAPLRSRPRLMIGLATISVPVAYIIYRHIDWKSTSDGKKRMLISHATFWPIAFGGIHLMHRGIKNWGKSPFFRQVAPWMAGAIATIITGFEGSNWLANRLAPKRLPSSPTVRPSIQTTPWRNQASINTGPVHQPGFYPYRPTPLVFSVGTASVYPGW